MKLGVEFSFRIFFIQEQKINLFHILNLFMAEQKKDNRNLCPRMSSYIFRVLLYQLPRKQFYLSKNNKKNHNNLAQSNDDIMYRKIQMISLLLWHISYLIKYLKQILQPNAFHMYPPEQNRKKKHLAETCGVIFYIQFFYSAFFF